MRISKLAFILLAAMLVSISPAKAGGDKAKDGKAEDADKVVSIPGFVVSVDGAYGPVGVLMVDAALEIKDPAIRAKVQKSMPRLRDAMRTALTEYSRTQLRPKQAPDPDAIARQLQGAADQVLGKKGAAEVLIINMMVSRNNRRS